jgi:hypothetical protein
VARDRRCRAAPAAQRMAVVSTPPGGSQCLRKLWLRPHRQYHWCLPGMRDGNSRGGFSVIGRRLYIIAIVVLGILVVGCADHRPFIAVNTWFNPTGHEADFRRLDEARIHPVNSSHELWAEAILANVSFAEITAEQAEQCTGGTLPSIPGTKPYIVRGVYLNRGTGQFEIRVWPNNNIEVFHGCLGDHPVPMKRQVLVLQLENPPNQVFVSCRMIE